MSQQRYIVGIAGGSGSGKTSFVKELKQKFSTAEICFISLDDYYLPREDQYSDNNGIKNFDLPTSIKSEELAADLDLLTTGKSITKTQYTFNNSEAEAKEILFEPAPIIVIEGLFIYDYELLKSRFDLKLYIDAKDELKLIRRIKRDKTERNYPLEDVLYRYEHHVMPAYRNHIGKYKEDADIIINNNDNFEIGMRVISTYLKSILKD